MDATAGKHRPSKLAILGIWLLFFIVLGFIAVALCNFRMQYVSESILNQQKEIQRAWLDKSLDSIRVWRNELVDQARYISSAEMFRLFAVDAKTFPREKLETLGSPDALNSDDESLRAMAEHMTYIQALLKDFLHRRAWGDARILLADGQTLVEPEFSIPLSARQLDLVRQVGKTGKAAFGPIHSSEHGLVMSMADPLFAVLGQAEPVAVLFLTIPMEKPLAAFLSRGGDGEQTLLPRIVFANGDVTNMALPGAGGVVIEKAVSAPGQLDNLPFESRKALSDRGEVYSMGGGITAPDWLFVLETPAAEINALIDEQRTQIYAVGLLAALGIALLCAFVWAALSSRRHEAHAVELQKKNDIISSQKLMLDSINASITDGLALVDAHQQIVASNPEFASICGSTEAIPQYTPLVRALPDKAAIAILSYMARLDRQREQDKKFLAAGSASMELELPAKVGDPESPMRIYRITFYPYSDYRDGKSANGGYVATFRDVTDFKRKAKEKREREETLLSALGRAIESVDPSLVGHSDKMAKVAALLSDELEENGGSRAEIERDRETLRLSSRLSQIGKLFVPRELLTKQGKLTPEELQELRKAPAYADKALHNLHFDLPVRETVAMIGERLDGSGKPHGLKGDAISRAGRALAVINAFIAMTSSRSWRGASMEIDEAIAQLQGDGGFDQDIVAALAAIPRGALYDAINNAQ